MSHKGLCQLEEVKMDEKIEDIALRDKVGKPQVTEEFVKKWAGIIRHADTGLFGIKGELKLVRQMLKEAGVRVA